MELMIVSSIIAILITILVPRIGHLIQTANEGGTKGKLGSVRSALSIYYADVEGFYPSDLTPFTTPGNKYVSTMLPVYTAAHGNIHSIDYFDAFDATQDAGGWGYVNSGTTPGQVWVECAHTDAKRSFWTAY